MPSGAFTIGVFGAAALAGLTIGFTPAIGTAIAPDYPETVSGCWITDGDTIRCGKERIRLLGIDAPELPGHCPTYRRCVDGDGEASKSSLDEALVGPLSIQRVGTDDYGRTLAIMKGALGDLSCWQLAHRQAIYKMDWDNGLRVARLCPRETLPY